MTRSTLPVFDQVDDIRAAFVHFVDGFDFDARAVRAAAVPRVAIISVRQRPRSFADGATWRLS